MLYESNRLNTTLHALSLSECTHVVSVYCLASTHKCLSLMLIESCQYFIFVLADCPALHRYLFTNNCHYSYSYIYNHTHLSPFPKIMSSILILSPIINHYQSSRSLIIIHLSHYQSSQSLIISHLSH